ncbi:hypothetical protein MTR67_018210 [Solanum verrucosum]|uniref:Uncharacterized protein n=1 Tax=Solanum verrucosum TaxID=315347 RepID=A0AAF0QPC2_SOLVR|nr:hypothetical protein MTR67_018210 [Solanum verrucosum]
MAPSSGTRNRGIKYMEEDDQDKGGGALYYVERDNLEEEIEVNFFVTNGGWDKGKLEQYVSQEMVDHICDNITPPVPKGASDTSWWMGNTSGRFLVQSA